MPRLAQSWIPSSKSCCDRIVVLARAIATTGWRCLGSVAWRILDRQWRRRSGDDTGFATRQGVGRLWRRLLQRSPHGRGVCHQNTFVQNEAAMMPDIVRRAVGGAMGLTAVVTVQPGRSDGEAMQRGCQDCLQRNGRGESARRVFHAASMRIGGRQRIRCRNCEAGNGYRYDSA